MPQIRTIRTRAEMDQRYYDLLVQLIRSQGYRELAAATVFAEALHLVPTIRFKRKVVQHIQEEMEHFEVCCDLHDSLAAGDLDAYCTEKLQAERPIPPRRRSSTTAPRRSSFANTRTAPSIRTAASWARSSRRRRATTASAPRS